MILDPNSWHGLGMMLALDDPSYIEWDDAPWLTPLPPVAEDDGDTATRKAFAEAEAPHVQRIEAAINQFIVTGERPPLSDIPLYFFSLRCQVVGVLLSSFEGILPPPAPSQQKAILRSFLIDWWRRNGPLYGVGFTYAEK